MANDTKSVKVIVEVGGKQHVAALGEKIKAVQTGAKEGETIIATDLLTGKNVSLKVLKNFLDKKILGLKFHSKSRYTRRYGHRQRMSLLELTGETKTKSEPKKADSAQAKKPAKSKAPTKKEAKS